MKKKKIVWGVVIGLLLLVVAAVMVVALKLDSIVKAGVEAVGPKITGVTIKLDEMHIALLTGSARVKGLVVGNPDGYKTPNAISVGVAEIGVNPLSVFSEKIVVRTINVKSPEITFEGGLGGNNLGKIMDNVNAVARSGGPPTTNAPAKPGDKTKPAKKIEVDEFLITGAKVHVSLTELGGKEMTLTLPDIKLPPLGAGPGGISPTELTKAVLQAVTTATVKAVAKAATSAAADVGKRVETIGKDAGKSVGEGVDKLKKGIGGLLGK